jgi:hypothetical protein
VHAYLHRKEGDPAQSSRLDVFRYNTAKSSRDGTGVPFISVIPAPTVMRQQS